MHFEHKILKRKILEATKLGKTKLEKTSNAKQNVSINMRLKLISRLMYYEKYAEILVQVWLILFFKSKSSNKFALMSLMDKLLMEDTYKRPNYYSYEFSNVLKKVISKFVYRNNNARIYAVSLLYKWLENGIFHETQVNPLVQKLNPSMLKKLERYQAKLSIIVNKISKIQNARIRYTKVLPRLEVPKLLNFNMETADDDTIAKVIKKMKLAVKLQKRKNRFLAHEIELETQCQTLWYKVEFYQNEVTQLSNQIIQREMEQQIKQEVVEEVPEIDQKVVPATFKQEISLRKLVLKNEYRKKNGLRPQYDFSDYD